jgi:hypothetical protein
MARTKGSITHKIDMDEVEKLASIGVTQTEMAQWFGCSLATIERRLAEPANHVILEHGRAKMLMSIRRQQISMMMGGSVAMAIFLGKQYLGQRDKIDHAISKEPGGMTYEEFLRTSRELLIAESEEKKKK